MMATQQYSSEDIQQILAIALERASSAPVPLQEIAAELSIDEATLRYAEDVWQEQRAKAKAKEQRQQQFYRQSLLPYVVVNVFLVGLNIAIAGSLTWAIYPLLGWGAGLLLELATGASPAGLCSARSCRRRRLHSSMTSGEAV